MPPRAEKELRIAKALINEVPTSWLDSLLTGPTAVIGNAPYNCQDIERLFKALKQRMEKKAFNPTRKT